MKKIALVGIIVLASLILASTVFAAAFVNPPESSSQAWTTSYPYQRNIYWDFASDPISTDPDYAGYDDPSLQSGDTITMSSEISWFNTLLSNTGTPTMPAFSTSRTGFIGIDNRWGTTDLTGTATFHIANLPENNPIKHIWEEIEYYEHDFLDPISTVGTSLILDTGYSVNAGWDDSEGLTDGFDRYNVWYEILPNPFWEEIIFTFTVAPGTLAVIDSFHIATECIPEPMTMVLLGSLATGLFGVAGIRRKK